MKKYVLAACLGLFSVQVANAADDGLYQSVIPISQDKDWALQVTPYMWAAGLDGDISPFRQGPTISIEKPFSDVLDDLNFGGFINIWGRYDRFVLSGDLMYVDTSDSKSLGPLPSFTIPGVGTIPAGGTLEGRVDSKQFNATLMGGYRVVDTPEFTLDALAGARLWHISNDATITGSLGGLSGSVSYGESFGWLDPLIGARAFFSFTENLSAQVQADIGGFDAGSELTWSVLGTVNYTLSDSLSVSGGYKVLSVNYNDDGHVFDTRLSGPVLGMTYRF